MSQNRRWESWNLQGGTLTLSAATSNLALFTQSVPLFSRQKGPKCRWQVVCCHSSLGNLTEIYN